MDLILRHPRWFWLSFAAVLALMLAFQPVTNVILDVVGTVILYVVVLGGIFLAGRGAGALPAKAPSRGAGALNSWLGRLRTYPRAGW